MLSNNFVGYDTSRNEDEDLTLDLNVKYRNEIRPWPKKYEQCRYWKFRQDKLKLKDPYHKLKDPYHNHFVGG